MLIIADSSSLIALATCDALELLPHLFEAIQVPQAVYEEVDELLARVLALAEE